MFVSRPFEGEMWTGQGEYSTKFYTGRLSPEVQPLTLLYTVFDRESTAFMYLPLANGTPFVYLVSNFASLLTAVNALSFKNE